MRRNSSTPSWPEVAPGVKFMSWMTTADVLAPRSASSAASGEAAVAAGDVVDLEQHAQRLGHRRLVLDDQDVGHPQEMLARGRAGAPVGQPRGERRFRRCIFSLSVVGRTPSARAARRWWPPESASAFRISARS